MKLDMDLAREILLQAEATPPNQFPKISLPDIDPDALTEHVQLLAEAGLLEANILPSGLGSKRLSKVVVRRLTWEGHQLLQAAHNEEIWQRTKRFVTDKGGTITLELLKVLLVKMAAQHFGLSP